MFKEFKIAVESQLSKMSEHELFYVDVNKDELWELYLNSFPEGTNPIFRERREYDCSCCRQFIRNIGNVVAIIDNTLVSIWDININNTTFKPVAKALADKIKSCSIEGIFRSHEQKIGTDYNFETVNDEVLKWEHFYHELDSKFILNKSKSIGDFNGVVTANHDVFKRSVTEITLESCEIVEELINQNSLYRGEEHLTTVKLLKNIIKEYKQTKINPELYYWLKSSELKEGSRIKNTVIGTLLSDLSDGVELEQAVKSFETKVAPQNYKRTTALVTKRMIEQAENKIKELGIEESLPRRYATQDDITINNILYADRQIKNNLTGSVFDELKSDVIDKIPNFDKIQEITIDKFINDVIPTANTIELMVDNSHINNLVSIIAPVNSGSPNILKWNNNFSWSYNGEVTDSIKERVKRAGGNVSALLRTSLSWYNYDDLDIHAIEPNGNKIYFRSKTSNTGGRLDVDMNAGGGTSREAVENITWNTPLEGNYQIIVHNFNKRENKDVGFEVELEFNDKSTIFSYNKTVKYDEKITVIEFNYTKKNGIKIIKSLPISNINKDIWGITTNKWVKVEMIMNSPNHWDNNCIGNKHWFFILNGCKNPDSSRGLYNEFIQNNLNEHRKVFELLGTKLKAEYSDKQLSGVGFSSTVQNELICKVSGKTNRILKIKF